MNNLSIKLFLAFLATLALSILPMPESFAVFRPPWVLLLLLYMEYFIPGAVSIVTLLFIGLLLDVLLATVIGEHSLSLLLVVWLATTRSRRFRFFSMFQQIILVGIFCFLYQLTINLSDAFLSFNYSLVAPFASAFLSMFLWPWIRLLGESLLQPHLSYRE